MSVNSSLTAIAWFLSAKSGRHFGDCGSWHPEVGHDVRPRLLMCEAEKAKVQARLAEDPFKFLYSNRLSSRFGGNIGGVFEKAHWEVGPRKNWKLTAGRALVAKNAAFVLFVDRDSDGLSPLDGQTKNKLRDNCILYLSNIDSRVRCFWTNYGDVQWRAKELAYYCQAYDLLMAVADERVLAARENIEAKIHELAANLFEILDRYKEPWLPFVTSKNNKRLIAAAALGIAALTIGHRGSAYAERSANINSRKWRPDSWIGAAMNSVFFLLRSDNDASLVTNDGAYREGPHYFRYVANMLLPFLRGMKHFRQLIECPGEWQDSYFNFGKSWQESNQLSNPFGHPAFSKIFDYYTETRQPEGRLPAIKDSYIFEYFPELALMAEINNKYAWPFYSFDPDWKEDALLNTALAVENGADSRADYICAGPKTAQPEAPAAAGVGYQDSGTYLFRSQTVGGSFYFHLIGGHKTWGSSSHYHEDAASFIINFDGQVMALDPGYIQTKKSHLVNKAEHHNVLLVSGQSLSPDDRFYFREKINHKSFYLARISDNKKVENSRRFRSLIAIKDSQNALAFIFDECAYSDNKTFTTLIHGNGLQEDGTFEIYKDQKKASWKHNDRFMDVVSLSLPLGTLETGTSLHENGYDRSAQHTVLKHKVCGKKAKILSVFSLHNNKPLTITELDTGSANGCGCLITDPQKKDYGYIVLMGSGQAQKSVLSLPGFPRKQDIASDAQFLLLSIFGENGRLDCEPLLSLQGSFVEFEGKRLLMNKESAFSAEFYNAV